MSAAVPETTERQLLEAACAGDEDAFRRLVEPYRPGLHAHCYRTLGSLHDTEDALQDALLRAWRGLCRFEGRSSLRTWLYRIATNASLDTLARRPKRVLPIGASRRADAEEPGGPWTERLPVEADPGEPLDFEDDSERPAVHYERREAVELAFVTALRHLSARQRAVLILREVLGFSAREVSQALGTTVASVNSALQRARKAVDERPLESSRQATVRSVGDERLRALVGDLVDALERADVGVIVSLLTEEATRSAYAEWPAREHGSVDSAAAPQAVAKAA